MMHYDPILMVAWAAFAICYLALVTYRGQLSRHRDDRLFLNDQVPEQVHLQNRKIISRVRIVVPLTRIFGGIAGIMTIGIVSSYVWHAWQVARFSGQ